MKNKKGFTLIELLATIVIIALVAGLVTYVAINVIGKSKDKTYEVTINEIETNASNYLIENNQRLFYLTSQDGTYEYQCITVENLVDYGYLKENITKSKISEDETVAINDYIYIERDANTKGVTKTLYVHNNTEYQGICGKAVIALGNIAFLSNPSFNEWSTYKDVTITYTLKSLNDQRTLSDYQFNHSYSSTNEYNSANDTLVNNIKTKHIRIKNNGKLDTNIKLNGEVLATNNITVDRIDITPPVVAKGNYTGSNKVRHTVTIPLTVSDVGSGFKHSSFTKDDIVVMVGSAQVTNITLTKVDNSKYNLVINSDLYNGKVTLSIAAGKVLDNIDNGNNAINIDTGVTFDNTYKITYHANGGSGAPSVTTYVYATSGTVPLSGTSPSRTGYTFKGWSTSSSATSPTYSASGGYPKNVMQDVTLYAVWSINYYYYDVNGWLDGGSNGGVSGFGTFDVYINGSLVANDVSDYYTQHPYGTRFQISDIRNTAGHTYNGVHSGPTSGTITGTTSTYLSFSTNYYYYDVNGWLDGGSNGGIGGFGTFDVYINGSLVANDVSDYYTRHPYGTRFQISDVRSSAGHTYNGVYSGPTSGTLTGATATYLSFSTNYYYLDVNGRHDGSNVNNLNGFGRVDVYINGTLVADNVSDYWAAWPYGTSYQITDIHAVGDNDYDGVYSGSASGVITDTTTVVLKFSESCTGCCQCYCCCSYCGGPYTCWPVGC